MIKLTFLLKYTNILQAALFVNACVLVAMTTPHCYWQALFERCIICNNLHFNQLEALAEYFANER
jgi:hypothetical protein